MRMIDVRAGEFLPSLDFHGKTGRIEGGRWGWPGFVLAVASGAAHAHDSGFLFFLTGVCQTFFCDYERYPGSSSRAVPYGWGGYCADPAECG